MKKNEFGFIIIFCFLLFDTYAQESIKIGNQVWMKKNLDTDRFANGEPILEARTDKEWKRAEINKQPAWCYYNNNPVNGAKYGRLYNWYAVADSRQLCPAGWHVPNINELEELFKLKNVVYFIEVGGYYDWYVCNNCFSWSGEYRRKVPCHSCKDNRWVRCYVPKRKEKRTEKKVGKEENFNLPGGMRNPSGTFEWIGSNGEWWSITSKWEQYSIEQYLSTSNDYYLRSHDYDNGINYGFSVRCLKGNATPKTENTHQVILEGSFEKLQEAIERDRKRRKQLADYISSLATESGLPKEDVEDAIVKLGGRVKFSTCESNLVEATGRTPKECRIALLKKIDYYKALQSFQPPQYYNAAEELEIKNVSLYQKQELNKISTETNISKENVEAIIEEDFGGLERFNNLVLKLMGNTGKDKATCQKALISTQNYEAAKRYVMDETQPNKTGKPQPYKTVNEDGIEIDDQ
jgi:hypothetical protein